MNRRGLIKLGGAALAASQVGRLGAADLKRLKVGVISDEVSDDFEAALRFLQRYGLRYVEVRTVWETYITEADDCMVRKARALLDKYRMIVPVMDTAYLKTTLPGTQIIEIDPAQFRPLSLPYGDQPALLERSLARAKDLGAPSIRIFSFWRTADPLSLLDPMAEHLARAAEIAARQKVSVLLENEHSCNVCTAEETAAIFNRVDHPNLNLNWDPANAFALGRQPFPDEYNRLPKSRIRHTHLRDAVRDPQTGKHKWMPIGKGQIDLEGMVRAMIRDGFRGMFSLETHYSHPTGNKELASKESLEGLLSLLRRV